MPKPRYQPRSDPLLTVTFYCRHCRSEFSAQPLRVVDAADSAHPWDYFAPCRYCEEEAGQAGWEKGVMRSFGKHTGPKTPAGLEASAANLEGHPTPEEAQRTRFNALRHGMHSRVATYFPARPGKYEQCEGCRYKEDFSCYEAIACQRRTEIFLRHHIAFDSGDPAQLLDMRSDLQASVWALINDMVLAIATTGVELKTPKYYFDPIGKKFHVVKFTDNGEEKFVFEISAHPLLKPLIDLVHKNNLSLEDMNMTPKIQDEHELVKGYLDDNSTQRQESEDYRAQIAHQQQQLIELIGNSRHRQGQTVDVEVMRDG